MEIYTVQYLPEKNYELLGMVYGNVVTSKNVVQDIGAVLKKIDWRRIRKLYKAFK